MSKTQKEKNEALKISNDTYNRVYERDSDCIVCNQEMHPQRIKDELKGLPVVLECHHFIPKSRMGLGVEQNLVMLCKYHHNEYTFIADRVEEYLKSKYEGWNKDNLVYHK